jgi:hypothetical protein
LHAQLGKQRLGRKILRPGFGTNGRKIQLLKSGSDGRARGFEAEPLTPELSIAPAPETDNRTGTVVLVLKPDIADDLPRLVRMTVLRLNWPSLSKRSILVCTHSRASSTVAGNSEFRCCIVATSP